MGEAYEGAKEYDNALKYYILSSELREKTIQTASVSDKTRLAWNYNAIARTYSYLENDQMAIRYYNLAADILNNLIDNGHDTYRSKLSDIYMRIITLYEKDGNTDMVEKYVLLLNSIN